MSLDRVLAPWTDEQVDALNAFQRDGFFHPFTCGGDRTGAQHIDGEGVLIATKDGWHCPYCGYRQAWAYAVMVRRLPE